jgi:hypothetical protein
MVNSLTTEPGVVEEKKLSEKAADFMVGNQPADLVDKAGSLIINIAMSAIGGIFLFVLSLFEMPISLVNFILGLVLCALRPAIAALKKALDSYEKDRNLRLKELEIVNRVEVEEVVPEVGEADVITEK